MLRRLIFAALFLVLGLVLSPLRAVAATVPMFFTYGVVAVGTATMPVGRFDVDRREVELASVTNYDDAPEGYDAVWFARAVGSARADRAYERAARGEVHGHGATYDSPAATIAAEGIEAAASETFQILDGVRRAKAAQLSGLETIAAELEVGGTTVATGEVPISSLLSPKSVIDTVSTPNALARWLNTLRQTAGGTPPPPIRITPGAGGTPIDLVRIGRP